MRATTLTRALLLGLALTALPLAACGGGRNYTLRGTQRDPGADGRVQVESLDGGNSLVTLTATNVTPPDRIGTGNTVYLVWIRTPNGQAQMESRLVYAPDERTGRATITTPQRRFTILVTAERDPNASTPSETIILTQDVAL